MVLLLARQGIFLCLVRFEVDTDAIRNDHEDLVKHSGPICVLVRRVRKRRRQGRVALCVFADSLQKKPGMRAVLAPCFPNAAGSSLNCSRRGALVGINDLVVSSPFLLFSLTFLIIGSVVSPVVFCLVLLFTLQCTYMHLYIAQGNESVSRSEAMTSR